MTLPNNSVLVTPGSGETIATHAVASKEYQAVMIADGSGHLSQSVPTYFWWLPAQVTGVSKLFGDLFNASGSGVVLDILGVWAIPKSDVAVAGVIAVPVGLFRTSAVGTGGTAHAYNTGSVLTAATITPCDTGNAALPAQVTSRSAPTGGATIAAPYWEQYLFTEETNGATYTGAFTNLLPVGTGGQRLRLNVGEGLLIKEGPTASPIGSLAFLTQFTVL